MLACPHLPIGDRVSNFYENGTIIKVECICNSSPDRMFLDAPLYTIKWDKGRVDKQISGWTLTFATESIKMNIDERDLLNMLRHAYLMGFNAGGLCQMKDNTDESIDEALNERDPILKELISEFKEDGYMSYNDDPGSHLCDDDCPATQTEQWLLEEE